MSRILENIIGQCVIVPLSKEKINGINTVCKNYLTNASLAQLELCVEFYLFNKVNQVFKKDISTALTEQDIKFSVLPSIVYRGIAGYVVYLSLADDSSLLDVNEKERLSLYIKNYTLCLKVQHDSIPYPEILCKMFINSDNKREDESTIGEIDKQQLDNIFSANDFEEIDITDKNTIFKEVKNLSQRVEKFEYEKLVTETAQEDTNNQFQMAFNSAVKVCVTPKWNYVDENPIKTLKKIIGNKRQEKTIHEIKQIISVANITYNANSRSSVLLRYLNNKDNIIDISNIKISCIYFAIYVYYELFLERLNRNTNE
jgi:hypothetical protein